ncbi:MAG: hypothetical protein M1503_03305 [Thaumarchaeota archaeon]|nr:hypothetical protein [Nitrososphaerota archaeon]MCL5317280.1 hypothetical protein [Nitrososphaerota archaeon]
MNSIELTTPAEIERFVDILNRYSRAPLSAYWQICITGETSLKDLKFPVSSTVFGNVEKKARRLRETGKIGKVSRGRDIAWDQFDQRVLRSLKKLNLIAIEESGNQVFIKPLVDRVVFKVGEGRHVEQIEDIAEAHNLIRDLRGESRVRLFFERRLKQVIPDTVVIIFPVAQE